MRLTQRENDNYVARKLRHMTQGHEANFDIDDEQIRVKIFSNRIIKTTFTSNVDEVDSEPIPTEVEISIAQLESLLEVHMIYLDGRIDNKKKINLIADKYESHTARKITDEVEVE